MGCEILYNECLFLIISPYKCLIEPQSPNSRPLTSIGMTKIESRIPRSSQRGKMAECRLVYVSGAVIYSRFPYERKTIVFHPSL